MVVVGHQWRGLAGFERRCARNLLSTHSRYGIGFRTATAVFGCGSCLSSCSFFLVRTAYNYSPLAGSSLPFGSCCQTQGAGSEWRGGDGAADATPAWLPPCWKSGGTEMRRGRNECREIANTRQGGPEVQRQHSKAARRTRYHLLLLSAFVLYGVLRSGSAKEALAGAKGESLPFDLLDDVVQPSTKRGGGTP